MAEFKRKEEELTTADIAGRAEKPLEAGVRPQLVRNQSREPLEGTPSATDLADETRASRFSSQSSGLASEAPAPVTPARSAESHSNLTAGENPPTALFSESEVGDFRTRWSNIQTAFVDEPRRVVEDADNLVASLMKRLAEGFADERARLEKQWDRGDNVSTEDLRVALQRYRSFFDRLLKV